MTDAQAKQIIEQHEKEMLETLRKLDLAKARQLLDLESKLAERRNKREQDLRNKQEQEAIQAGLPPPPIGKH